MVKTLPSNAGGVGLISGWGAKIPHALGPKNQSIKQKQYCNKFNKKWSTSKNLKKNLIKPIKMNKEVSYLLEGID